MVEVCTSYPAEEGVVEGGGGGGGFGLIGVFVWEVVWVGVGVRVGVWSDGWLDLFEFVFIGDELGMVLSP